MKTPSLPLVLTLWALSCVLFLRAAEPLVSNVRATQNGFTREVLINYDLSLSGAASTNVSLQVSSNGGGSWVVPANTLSGNGIGSGVTPAKGKLIVWNAMTDWPGQLSPQTRFKITASDTPPITGEFALIPAGSFQMGDQSNPLVGYSDERPVHSVYVSAFYMGRYEVTKELWDTVRAWGMASGRGYTDLAAGNGSYASKGVNHPVHSISWYDMVKWCNARSEKENLVPCYTVGGLTYKTGQSDAVACNWNASGYRLPTEAEWEKAARGTLSGKNFPWGDTITHSQANYYSSSSYNYDVSPTRGYHPTYAVGGYPYSSPVGSFAPEPNYGLYDMAGNMWEWCWDWYGSYPSTSQSDPRGPATGSDRVFRGGGWYNAAYYARCADRNGSWPGDANRNRGFRLARGQP